jgi:hypothetical protein
MRTSDQEEERKGREAEGETGGERPAEGWVAVLYTGLRAAVPGKRDTAASMAAIISMGGCVLAI